MAPPPHGVLPPVIEARLSDQRLAVPWRHTHLSRVHLCNPKVVHDFYEFSWSLKDSRHFLVSYTDESQGAEEGSTDEVVAMNLRTSNFMPYRRDCSVMRCCRDGTVYSCSLILTMHNGQHRLK